MRIDRSPHSIEPIAWHPELAYAIGLIATDGNLSMDGRHISLTSSDIEQLTNFKKCLGTNAKLARNAPGSFSRNPSHRVQFSDSKFYRQLLAVGLSPRKTGSLGALQIPSLFFRDFLRGVIDGDGSIVLYTDRYRSYKGTRYEYLRAYVTITSASLPFLQWIHATLQQGLSVRGSVLKQSGQPHAIRPIWRLRFAKTDSIKLFHWIYYSKHIPCLMRKRSLAEHALATFQLFRDKRCKWPQAHSPSSG